MRGIRVRGSFLEEPACEAVSLALAAVADERGICSTGFVGPNEFDFNFWVDGQYFDCRHEQAIKDELARHRATNLVITSIEDTVR